jgi:hypothetical protein
MNTPPVCTTCSQEDLLCTIDEDDFEMSVTGTIYDSCPGTPSCENSIVAIIGTHRYEFAGTIKAAWIDLNDSISVFRADPDDLNTLKDFLQQIVRNLNISSPDPYLDYLDIEIKILFHAIDPRIIDPLCTGYRLKDVIYVDIHDRDITKDIDPSLDDRGNGCGWL